MKILPIHQSCYWKEWWVIFCNSDLQYRVSHNIVSTFVLLNSWPPKHLEVPSWTFFNSPFRVDFRTIQFAIIWWNLVQDIAMILKGSHFKNNSFIFTELQTWTLRNTEEHLWELLSIDVYGVKLLWELMAHGTKLMIAYYHSWVLSTFLHRRSGQLKKDIL